MLNKPLQLFVFLVSAAANIAYGPAAALAQDGIERVELRRAGLTGVAGTEVITATLEAQPGARVPQHIHHGDEFLYVLQGGSIQAPGKEPMRLEAGATLHFPREVSPGGFTVTGDMAIKVLTVHIVDVGKPLMHLVE